MTVDQIIDKIRTLAHDRLMAAENIYDFINMAIQDVEARGDYNWQLYKEDISVAKDSQTINFTKTPVKRIISTDPEEVDLSLVGGTPKLATPASEDTTITFLYTFKHPLFDGAEINKIIPDDWLYIYGGTYYALLHNQDPAAPVYQQVFREKLNNHYEENMFILPIDSINEEISGV